MRVRYKIVLADPPWEHYGDPNKDAAAGKHYDLMGQSVLKLLPARDILDGKGAMFLWATGPRLHYAIEALNSWGLHFRGVAYVWVKTNKAGNIILGQGIPPTFTKPTTEFLLAATTMKSGRPFPIHTFNQGQVVLAPRGPHSEKPEIFYRLIEELCGDVPRIELFARKQYPGWDTWGIEAPAQSIDLNLVGNAHWELRG
ncbi:MAG: MT-A70 family methyltransferase [Fimbriimonadaceae bacterium]